jgi:hypothetical protein
VQSSTYIVGHAQANGRRYVEFVFTLDDGSTQRTERGPLPVPEDTAQATTYLDALAAEIGAQIEATLAEQEFEQIIGGE